MANILPCRSTNHVCKKKPLCSVKKLSEAAFLFWFAIQASVFRHFSVVTNAFV